MTTPVSTYGEAGHQLLVQAHTGLDAEMVARYLKDIEQFMGKLERLLNA